MVKISKNPEPIEMASLCSDVTNAIWHVFDYNDQHHKGLVVKQALMDFTTKLGLILGNDGAGTRLESYKCSEQLHFSQFMCFLEKDLFAPFQATLSDIKVMQRTRDQIEELCWDQCKTSFLNRSFAAFPDRSVYQIFRVFCFLAELRDIDTNCNPAPCCEVLLNVDEVEELCRSFVQSLGERWDSDDFNHIATVLPPLHLQALLAFLETRYATEQDLRGLAEAAAEMYDIYIGDVIKKGPIRRKHYAIWWEYIMVVRPHFLQFYTNKGKKISEIQLTTRSTVEHMFSSNVINNSINMSVNNSPRGHKFLVRADPDSKVLELSAPCYKSKLQWMAAIQCAINHSQTARTYQKYLAGQRKIKRREKRDAEDARKRELEEKINEQITKETTELKNEIVNLQEKVKEECQAKRDEEIVRTLQARMLAQEWEHREKLEKELERTKMELVKTKCDTVSLKRAPRAAVPKRSQSWAQLNLIGITN